MALFLIGLIVTTYFLSPVGAFKVVDHAMCKDVSEKTNECVERTSEFQPSDEWAFFWLKGNVESSDRGARAEIRFYDPDGKLYHTAPCEFSQLCPAYERKTIDWRIQALGDIVAWMAIQIAGNTVKFYLSSTHVTVTMPWNEWQGNHPPSSRPGAWRAEFTLGGKVVNSEVFSIGKAATSPSANSLEKPTTVMAADVAGTKTNLARLLFRLSPISGGDLCFEDAD